jgi:hypothetical protein
MSNIPKDIVMNSNVTVGDLEQEEFQNTVEEQTVTMPNGEEKLVDLMDDITEGHEELTAYKEGALAMCGSLNRAKVQAQANGNKELAEALSVVNNAAFGLYLRLKEGDAELFGEQSGEYDDYFDGI